MIPAPGLTCICQIPCGKKHAPQIRLPCFRIRTVKICISQFRNQYLFHTFTGDQRLDFCLGCFRSILDHILNNGIAAAVFPMRLHLCICVFTELVALVQYIPRTIYIHMAKMVSIIPFFYICKSFFNAIICQEFLDLAACESKIPCKINIGNGVYHEIIQPRENTFPGNTQTSGDYGKFKARICLKRLAEQGADQPDHLGIIVVLVCFVQRHVIFIYEDNDASTIMLCQHF